MGTLPDDTTWAVTEFAEAELGDLRRTQRVVELATVLAQRPGASLPEACGDRATLKAAYRFFDNAAITPQNLLDSHVDATLTRLATVPLVLAVQDTTELDWTAHPATTGLGPLGHPAHRGLHVHTTLAFTPERVPLGLLAQQVWARDPNAVGKRATRKQRPIAEKESQKWLTSVEAVLAARGACPQTRWVSVGDREADVYDLFAMERPAGVDLLIRAAWDRCVTQPEHYVWATVAARPLEATYTVQVPRRGAQPPRTATLGIRWCPLTLCPPGHRKRERLPAVPLWAVQALEEAPPAGTDPDRVAVADHVCRPHACRGAHAGGLVCLSLGRGSLAQNFEKWLSDRSPPVGDRRAPPAVSAALQRYCLADFLCHHAEPGCARRAVYGAVGTGGMAGPVLRHPSDAHAA